MTLSVSDWVTLTVELTVSDWVEVSVAEWVSLSVAVLVVDSVKDAVAVWCSAAQLNDGATLKDSVPEQPAGESRLMMPLGVMVLAT